MFPLRLLSTHMIRFFRKIRQGLLADGKIFKYLTYAAGEILLVIIGILAALSINNWNESIKNKRKVEDILLQIQNDIRTNILETARGSNYYFYKDSLVQLILNDEIDYFNFEDVNLGTAKNLITNVSPISLIDNGFKNWTTHEQIPEEYQEINAPLNTLFVDWKNRMNHRDERLTTMVNENIKFMADNYTWYYPSISGKIPEHLARKEAAYFQYDSLYKNKVAIYVMAAVVEYLPLIDAYRNLSVRTYQQIDKLLGKPVNETDNEFFLPSTTLLEKLTGTYQDPNNPTLRPTLSVGENGLMYRLDDFEALFTPISNLSFLNAQYGAPAKITFDLRGDSVYIMTESQYGEYTKLQKID